MLDNEVVHAPSPGLWSALKEQVPELALVARGVIPEGMGPGQRAWLMTQYALNISTRMIIKMQDQIIADQEADGMLPWRPMTMNIVNSLRNDWQDEWTPIALRLAERIESVGVLSKNQRLMALLRLAEDLESRMFDEQDKQLRKYLISEYRAVLRQIAEEKGELGEPPTEANDAYWALAKLVSDGLRIQGTRPLAIQEATSDNRADGDGLRVRD